MSARNAIEEDGDELSRADRTAADRRQQIERSDPREQESAVRRRRDRRQQRRRQERELQELREEIAADFGGVDPMDDVIIDIGDDRVSGRVRDELVQDRVLEEAAEDSGRAVDELVIEESDDGFAARVREDVIREELRRETAEETGFDVDEVVVERSDDGSGFGASIREDAIESRIRSDVADEFGIDTDDVVLGRDGDRLTGRAPDSVLADRTRADVASDFDVEPSDVIVDVDDGSISARVDDEVVERRVREDVAREADVDVGDVLVDRDGDGISGRVDPEVLESRVRDDLIEAAREPSPVVQQAQDRLDEVENRFEAGDASAAEVQEAFQTAQQVERAFEFDAERDLQIDIEDDSVEGGFRDGFQEDQIRSELAAFTGFDEADILIDRSDEGVSGRVDPEVQEQRLRENFAAQIEADDELVEAAEQQLEEATDAFESGEISAVELQDAFQISQSADRLFGGLEPDEVLIDDSEDSLTADLPERFTEDRLRAQIAIEAGPGVSRDAVLLDRSDDGVSGRVDPEFQLSSLVDEVGEGVVLDGDSQASRIRSEVGLQLRDMQTAGDIEQALEDSGSDISAGEMTDVDLFTEIDPQAAEEWIAGVDADQFRQARDEFASRQALANEDPGSVLDDIGDFEIQNTLEFSDEFRRGALSRRDAREQAQQIQSEIAQQRDVDVDDVTVRPDFDGDFDVEFSDQAREDFARRDFASDVGVDPDDVVVDDDQFRLSDSVQRDRVIDEVAEQTGLSTDAFDVAVDSGEVDVSFEDAGIDAQESIDVRVDDSAFESTTGDSISSRQAELFRGRFSAEQRVSDLGQPEQDLFRGSGTTMDRSFDGLESGIDPTDVLSDPDVSSAVDEISTELGEDFDEDEFRLRFDSEAGELLVDFDEFNLAQDARQQMRAEIAEQEGVDLSDVVVEGDLADGFRGTVRDEIDIPEIEAPVDQTIEESSAEPGEEDIVDSVRQPFQDASEFLQPRLRSAGDSAAGVVTALSPVTEAERLAFGTDNFENFIRGGGREAAAQLDLPGLADATIGLGDFAVRGSEDGTRRDVVADQSVEAARSFADALASDPAETTGRTAGAIAGGFGVGAAGARAGRSASRAARDRSPDFRLDDFSADSRGQLDLQPASERFRGGNQESLDDLMSQFEAAQGRRDAASRVEQRQLERAREAAQRQDPGEPRSLTPREFDTLPEQSFRTVTRGIDTSRSGPTRTQRRTARMSLDSGGLSPLERQLAAGIRRRQPADDLRSIIDVEDSLRSSLDASIGRSQTSQADAAFGAAVVGDQRLGFDSSEEESRTVAAPAASTSDVPTQLLPASIDQPTASVDDVSSGFASPAFDVSDDIDTARTLFEDASETSISGDIQSDSAGLGLFGPSFDADEIISPEASATAVETSEMSDIGFGLDMPSRSATETNLDVFGDTGTRTDTTPATSMAQRTGMQSAFDTALGMTPSTGRSTSRPFSRPVTTRPPRSPSTRPPSRPRPPTRPPGRPPSRSPPRLPTFDDTTEDFSASTTEFDQLSAEFETGFFQLDEEDDDAFFDSSDVFFGGGR